MAVVFTKYQRHIVRGFRKNPTKFAVVGVLCILCAGLFVTMIKQTIYIDPRAYAPLLQVVADGESNGNYNAYFGNAQNNEVRFTDMSIDEVLQWQQAYVQSGSPSSAVGRYQIIRPTLESLVGELDIERSQKFDVAMQDKMAIALMERRGATAYIGGDISREDFAANIAKEWAALPKVKGDQPQQSYYAGDGINKAHISIPQVLQAVDDFKAKHQKQS